MSSSPQTVAIGVLLLCAMSLLKFFRVYLLQLAVKHSALPDTLMLHATLCIAIRFYTTARAWSLRYTY
jgi:hypothetical protein